MSKSSNLPIYRSAYHLTSHLHQSTKKAPRELKFTLVQQLLSETVELCVDIADANRNSKIDRINIINEIQRRIGRIDTLLQVAKEQKCLSTGAMAVAIDHIGELARQSTGWIKSEKNRISSHNNLSESSSN